MKYVLRVSALETALCPPVKLENLIVISGPCKGQRIPLVLDAMKLGRDRNCEIHLDDEAASRAHSEIVKRGGKLVLRDLKSTNGTYQNDERIVEAVLQNGDRIGIGDSILLVQLPAVLELSAPQIVFSQDTAPSTGITLKLDSSFLSEGLDASRPSGERFTTLYQFMSELSGVLHQPALLERALDFYFKVFPVERGVILLMTPEGVPGLQLARTREGVSGGQNIAITRSLLQLLLQKKSSCLSSNLGGNQLLSMMAAPLKVKDKVGGLVYFDSTSPGNILTEDDLKLCSAMALQLAVCLENTRLYNELLGAVEFNVSILGALGSGIMVVDTKGRVLHLNRSAQEILDKSDSQLIGKALAELPDMADFHQAVQNTLKHGKPEDRYELKYKTATGMATLGLSSSLLTDRAGTIGGVVVNFRNLGALRKLEEQMRRAHYLEALGQMAAGVAHEIRNPLNSIRGFTQLVQEHEQTSAVSKEYTAIVLEEVQRMNNIVQDMLDFSRQRQLTLLPISIVKLMEDLVRDMQIDARQAKVTLEVLQPGETLSQILGNRDKLRQVFRNILLNGIQSCKPEGSVTIGFQPVTSQVVDPKTKSLDKTMTLREVVVHINDTGCGMTSDVMRKIFDPFFTQKETGTGLGLSISQKIVEQHHGRIEVKSEVNVGSTFSVHFPAIKESNEL